MQMKILDLAVFWTNKIVLDYQKIKPVTFKKKPSVCFVIPARNEEKYIAETIKSILLQNIKKFILIVDDSSTDSTIAEAKKILKKSNFNQYKIINGTSPQRIGAEKYGRLDKL